jgi:two-component system response regulator HydG
VRGQPLTTPPDARLAQQLVGRSRVMIEVRHRVRRFAELDTPVLVGGETGTGKEVVARLLHELSPRTDEPFTAINCGGLTESLIESELFGHVKGAFTGATRDHRGLFLDTREGTIFLDEVNAMSPRLQASLLRVLENGEVRAVGGSKVARIRCRVVAAANESLEHAVREKGFRADLYYRLSRLTIDLPPLRDRIEDLEPLSKHFLQSVYGPMEVVLGQDLLEAFGKYDWPGNVRELKNEIEHIALMAGGRQVLSADLFRKAPRAAEPETGKARKRRVNGDDKSAALPANSLLAQLQRSRPLNLRNTQTRRRLLKEMFEQYGRLTRAEIIRMLDCAPNTATRDLRELEDEGTIRRVKTSAHLRTSYFERVEE